MNRFCRRILRVLLVVALLTLPSLWALPRLQAQSGFGFPSNENGTGRAGPGSGDTVAGPQSTAGAPDAGPSYFSQSVTSPAAGDFGPADAMPGYDPQAPMGYKWMLGVDGSAPGTPGAKSTWRDEAPIPWEAFAYGEYLGPYRSPHVPNYRIRVDDQIEFVIRLTREMSQQPYRLQVGDVLRISSLMDNEQGQDELLQENVAIMPDGTISLRGIGQVRAARKTIAELQAELNQRYSKFYHNPQIVVHGTAVDTTLQDLRDAVDARQGVGGQGITVQVAADGTLQLPMVGSVPAVGLTLPELAREVNLRYRSRIKGIEFTPNVVQRAPQVVYVLGQVAQPGRFELNGPTTAMQSIALAQGWLPGANVRQVIVFRRDAQWRLMALRLDLNAALAGTDPLPTDEIWLRSGDIVLVPKSPIQRITELVDLYITQGVYSILPNQGIGTIFDADTIFGNTNAIINPVN